MSVNVPEGKWFRVESYPIDHCPRCGGDLDAPDDNRDRRCPTCHVTVCATVVTWEIVDG
jgi:tRNA(Ile2) C34 agmatinyltransferase TiaS